MSKLKRAARICFDVLIFVVACGAALALPRWVEPIKRGFFCNDESLQYPYLESTISVPALVATALLVPGLAILTLELLRTLNVRGGLQQQQRQQASTTPQHGYRLGYRLQQCVAQLGYYLFGMALTLVATHVAKLGVGRLRPHFFAVCQPQLPDGTSCADEQNHGRFVDQYSCAAPQSSADMLRQAGQSFPSAHASILFYAMLYTAIYVQYALSTRISKLLKHLLQFVLIMVAWYVALTRVSDFWHHWSDVLVGTLLGALLAVFVALCVARLDQHCSSSTGGGTIKLPVKPVATVSTTAKSATPVLPAYTFGSMSYLQHPQQYAQTYHNYGYVP